MGTDRPLVAVSAALLGVQAQECEDGVSGKRMTEWEFAQAMQADRPAVLWSVWHYICIHYFRAGCPNGISKNGIMDWVREQTRWHGARDEYGPILAERAANEM